ncbi:hypothetical protein Xen7305DRAFT_00048560 [Xenococcus sp. PCC 7305]|uniref:hypothetical protein n=1 Tax=Xenococcus sp. PCC 7305 TaxID=102125 RepID=UPI0002ACAA25|nr:hypothetical protein [Xenococcus sp. PCC 7305]ELS05116.1 hypothetical protein Xen7305DRAFT_00048560 [Xenococcus sp. PCC 7305]
MGDTTLSNSSPPNNLKDLETRLQDLSHNTDTIEIIKSFAKKLGKTGKKQATFNAKGALVRQPIEYQKMLTQGLISEEEDSFELLQGDIVSSDCAYFMGERITNTKFVIATSTCDLVPNRRQYAALFRIEQITQDYPNIKSILGNLLSFKSTKNMYLPPLPGDSSDVIANAIVFDGVIQIKLEDLLRATRHASLSLVGWRIFGCLVRNIMVRAGENEVNMRTSLQNNQA